MWSRSLKSSLKSSPQMRLMIYMATLQVQPSPEYTLTLLGREINQLRFVPHRAARLRGTNGSQCSSTISSGEQLNRRPK